MHQIKNQFTWFSNINFTEWRDEENPYEGNRKVGFAAVFVS